MVLVIRLNEAMCSFVRKDDRGDPGYLVHHDEYAPMMVVAATTSSDDPQWVDVRCRW